MIFFKADVKKTRIEINANKANQMRKQPINDLFVIALQGN